MRGLLQLLLLLALCAATLVLARVPRNRSPRFRSGVLQHDDPVSLVATAVSQVGAPQPAAAVAPHLVHEGDILVSDALDDETLIRATSSSKRAFQAQPSPYTHADPPCTSYARQDNCVNNPPLSPDPLPPCGGFSGQTPNTTVFAIIGDYGLDGNCESQVNTLVKKMQQQWGQFAFVMTTGDNAYWNGNCKSLHDGVVQYYGEFLANASMPCTDPMKKNVRGYVNPHWSDTKHFQEDQEKLTHELHRYQQKRTATHYVDANGTEELLTPDGHIRTDLPRFFPTLGNHDWSTYRADPLHLPYFQLFDYLMDFPPSDLAHGQFYQVSPLPGLELFSLNSNLGVPDATPTEQDLFVEQVNWLKGALGASQADFKFVFFHHPPYSTAQHDALAPWMDLPFEDWGASAVFVGHQHVYERLLVNRARADGSAPGMPFIINGLGGHPWTYTIDGCPPYPGSQFRYNTYHGAQLVVQSWDQQTHQQRLDVCFFSLENGGSLIDEFSMEPARKR